jgi:hypothetical protein
MARSSKQLIKAIDEISYHRNGISGLGFYAVRFTSDIEADDGAFNIYEQPDTAQPNAKFLACVFDEPGCVAVICTDRLESHGISFAKGNSWRGDRFEPELREAIKASNNTGRMGPFSVPTSTETT